MLIVKIEEVTVKKDYNKKPEIIIYYTRNYLRVGKQSNQTINRYNFKSGRIKNTNELMVWFNSVSNATTIKNLNLLMSIDLKFINTSVEYIKLKYS